MRNKNGSVERKSKTVPSGVDLMDVSGNRDVYEGYIIEDIYCKPDEEYISFTSKPKIVRLNQAIGVVNEDEYKRQQIRKTIEAHLEKELAIQPLGIKVLSLFFIDKVANYRWYDQDGNPQQGNFARMFEEEFVRAMRKPKYKQLMAGDDPEIATRRVHNGYFAQDKIKDSSGRNIFKDSKGEGKSQADESAYNLIMKDKERLLGFDSKLKFIFSHSALKEGWDNPNVFQICTLNETASTLKKRQEIGRGLRIAVNQDGERVHGFDVNTLTVMANESYEDFAQQLQKEIEDDEGIKFGIVQKHSFAGISVPADNGESTFLGVQASEQVWEHLFEQEYIDQKGKILNKLQIDLKNNIKECAEQIQDMLVVTHPKFINKTARLEIDRGGVQAENFKESTAVYEAENFELPDILTYLQNQTNLTRQTLARILIASNKLDAFKKNPQKYIEQVADIIKRSMRHFIVDGIKYQKLGDDYYYAQELFENNELFGYLHDNMLKSEKSVYSHVVFDSELERDFASAFERSQDIKVYAKLPGKFVIDTPLGSYNPDWAVLVENDGQNRLYFVVETKDSISKYDLRLVEDAKIKCGQEHFKALDTDVQFTKADKFETFADRF